MQWLAHDVFRRTILSSTPHSGTFLLIVSSATDMWDPQVKAAPWLICARKKYRGFSVKITMTLVAFRLIWTKFVQTRQVVGLKCPLCKMWDENVLFVQVVGSKGM